MKAITNEELLAHEPEKLYDAGNKCIKNALIHQDFSRAAYEKGFYGFGVAHLILGAEEVMKAIVVFAAFFKIDLPFDNINIQKIFKSHPYKYKKIKPLIEYKSYEDHTRSFHY
jgi:hypothetical protein